MCIRDSAGRGRAGGGDVRARRGRSIARGGRGAGPVSYTHLDVYKRQVLNVIRSLADRDTTMLIVTHEMQFARQVADNVLFMDEGVIVEYGSAEEVIGNPREERTRRFLERYSNG